MVNLVSKPVDELEKQLNLTAMANRRGKYCDKFKDKTAICQHNGCNIGFENKEDNIVFKKNNNDVIIQGYYSLKHLISFTKCTNLCQSLEIYIDNNYPLIIVYNIGNMGKLKLCLSPKEINT